MPQRYKLTVAYDVTHYAGWPRGTVALQAAGQASAQQSEKK